MEKATQTESKTLKLTGEDTTESLKANGSTRNAKAPVKFVQVFVQPVSAWRCPGRGCKHENVTDNRDIANNIMTGQKLSGVCNKCGQHMLLQKEAPDAPRIILPGGGPRG